MEDFDWPALPHDEFIKGHLATENDVKAGRAVFFLRGDAVAASIPIPQYALFRDDPAQEPEPCILIQAEETIDGCLVGLKRLDGTNILARLDDIVCLGQELPQ